MALQLQLGLPPTHSPRPSLATPKPPLPFFLLCSFPKISNARNRGLRGTLHFDHRFSLIAAVSSSSIAEAEAEAEAEESAESSGQPRNRLIAQNIPWTSTAEDIRSLFERHGTVLDVELSMYNKSRNRGLAFITMASEEEALAALNNLESYELDGRVIKVDFARSLKKKPPPETAVPVEKYTVFVGNLAWRLRSRDVRELFNANGNVLSADVIYQTSPRRSAGYGFVSFSSKEAAEAAIATFNGKRVMGRSISLVMKENTDDAEGKSNEDEQSDEASSEVTADEGLSQPAVPI